MILIVLVLLVNCVLSVWVKRHINKRNETAIEQMRKRQEEKKGEEEGEEYDDRADHDTVVKEADGGEDTKTETEKQSALDEEKARERKREKNRRKNKKRRDKKKKSDLPNRNKSSNSGAPDSKHDNKHDTKHNSSKAKGAQKKKTGIRREMINIIAVLQRNDVATFRRWLLRGMDPNTQGVVSIDGALVRVPLLIYAARGGTTEIALMLIAHGANVNMADSMGITPLMVAAEFGRTDIARMLIEHGGSVCMYVCM